MANKKQNNSSNKALIVIIVVAVFVIIAAITFIALPGEKKEDSAATTSSSSSEKELDIEELERMFSQDGDYFDGEGEELLSGKINATIEVADYGTIKVELDADAAPVTVTNFVRLANEGFYDGLTFHRIIEGFMMQGGDPEGNGTGGSGLNILGEFASNGVDNKLSHTRGAISMARSQTPNSGSSQFFICHEDATGLDGDYACFGYVTEGIEVVDAVCEAAEPTDNNGTIPSEAQPIITSITIE